MPDRLSPELGYFLGAYLSEGHTTRSNWSVILTNSVPEVLERAQTAIATVFGLTARLTHQPNRCTGLVVSSKRLVEYMDLLGCGGRASAKRVPRVIFGAGPDVWVPFLQGVALDAYTTVSMPARWAICLDSAAGITDLQDLLTELGIVNAQIAKWNKVYEKYYYELYAPGPAGQELSRLVPFLEPDKQERAVALQALEIGPRDWTDIIPGIRGKDLYGLIPVGRSGARHKGTGRHRFRHLCDPRTRHITRASVLRAVEAGAVVPTWLGDLVDSSIRFHPVIDVDGLPTLVSGSAP